MKAKSFLFAIPLIMICALLATNCKPCPTGSCTDTGTYGNYRFKIINDADCPVYTDDGCISMTDVYYSTGWEINVQIKVPDGWCCDMKKNSDPATNLTQSNPITFYSWIPSDNGDDAYSIFTYVISENNYCSTSSKQYWAMSLDRRLTNDFAINPLTYESLIFMGPYR